MSDTITFRVPDELAARLTRLSESTHRPKSYYVREALEEHLSELEHVAGLDARAEAVRRGDRPTRPIHELLDELGITQAEVDAAPLDLER